MSLLIDALKQAEATRQRSADEGLVATESEGLSLAPVESPSLAENAPVDTAAGPRPQVASRRHRAAEPAGDGVGATRELFEVKRPAPRRLPMIWLGLVAVVVLAGGVYVWWQMQPRSSLVANVATHGAALPVQEAPPYHATEPSTPAAPEMTAATPASGTAIERAAPAARSGRDKSRPVTPAPLAPAAEASVQIRHGMEQRHDGAPAASAVGMAYEALARGDVRLAQSQYQEALRQNPQNVDALNGLGLIAWRAKMPDQAERYFRAALRAEPTDSFASAQLALLYADGDATMAEVRLRNLVAAQPASAAAHFALGNLLSRQARWPEAQQALFQAYTLDSANPDVLFNLAVSLEHVKQPAVAGQFYERAVQASAQRPGGFDVATARSRMDALRGR